MRGFVRVVNGEFFIENMSWNSLAASFKGHAVRVTRDVDFKTKTVSRVVIEALSPEEEEHLRQALEPVIDYDEDQLS